MPKLTSKKKRELIDHLVGNCDCEGEPLFEKDDAGTLNKLDLEELERLSGNEDPDEESDDSDDSDDDDGDDKEAESKDNSKETVGNNQEKEQVFNLEKLPQEVREDIEFARNMKRQQKDQLIAKITVNKDGLFSKKELETKSVDELQKIASYVVENKDEGDTKEKTPKQTPRLGGCTNVTSNKEDDTEGEILVAPTINFASE